ncbi:MAG: carboxymuconolactone decarboxylase family protein [Candidatus Dormibacter sp.]|uniref:carboxymuconolactone decarboxylase family protein n=1 Tax=Candidatus Dormibacter sp. TaxID=2973982 RepID=UPI000DB6738A|nr:MAG: carboxymuconolactone decarboxylase [Candidatus Dormibacteraeota bacterium]
MTEATPSDTTNERFRRGAAKLMEIDGEHGPSVIDALADTAPDLGRYVVEFAFGDIYSRDDLDDRQRQLVTIGALTALGGAEPQLVVHINAALNVGLTPQEIVGAITHTAPFTGFPRTLNAILTARTVFEDRGVLPLLRLPQQQVTADGKAEAAPLE